MNEQALQAIVDKVVREIKAPQDMTLDIALSLAEKVKAKAVSMGVKAVVAISGRAGHPVLIECMDDSYIASYDVALQKAFTVVSLKMSTATFAIEEIARNINGVLESPKAEKIPVAIL